MRVEQEFLRRSKLDRVLAGRFSEACDPFPFQVQSIQVGVVGAVVVRVGGEVDPPGFLVDGYDCYDRKGAFCKSSNEVPVYIEQVEVIPPIPFRHPDEFVPMLQKGQKAGS